MVAQASRDLAAEGFDRRARRRRAPPRRALRRPVLRDHGAAAPDFRDAFDRAARADLRLRQPAAAPIEVVTLRVVAAGRPPSRRCRARTTAPTAAAPLRRARGAGSAARRCRPASSGGKTCRLAPSAKGPPSSPAARPPPSCRPASASELDAFGNLIADAQSAGSADRMRDRQCAPIPSPSRSSRTCSSPSPRRWASRCAAPASRRTSRSASTTRARVYDAAGETIAQGDHMPVHLGAMPLSVRAAIDHGADGARRRRRPERSVPRRHAPARHHAGLAGLPSGRRAAGRRSTSPTARITRTSAACRPGSMPLAREILPGRPDHPAGEAGPARRVVDDVLALILANVRTPDEREGDLTAQIAANRVAERRLLEIVAKYGRGARRRLCRGAAGLHRARAAARRSPAIPDGDYRFEDRARRRRLRRARRSRIRVARPDRRRRRRRRLHRLRSADDRRRQRQLRDHAVGDASTRSAAWCDEDVLYNAGIAPGGARHRAGRDASSTPCSRRRWPAATSRPRSGSPTSSSARSRRRCRIGMPAASQGTMNNVTLGGRHPRTGQPFAYYETIGGGMGGRPGLRRHQRRAHAHEQHAQHAGRGDRALPAGAHPPVRDCARAAAAPARWRGGDGIVREYEMLTETAVTVLSDRRVGAPYGAQGGAPGPAGPQHADPRRRRDGRCRGKARLTLAPGDRLRIESPGGGGYGSPDVSTARHVATARIAGPVRLVARRRRRRRGARSSPPASAGCSTRST